MIKNQMASPDPYVTFPVNFPFLISIDLESRDRYADVSMDPINCLYHEVPRGYEREKNHPPYTV